MESNLCITKCRFKSRHQASDKKMDKVLIYLDCFLRGLLTHDVIVRKIKYDEVT